MDEPEVKVFRGQDDGGRPRAEIRHKGAKLVIRWPADDTAAEQLPVSFEIYPDVEPLEPRVLRRFAPQAELYVALAQSSMRLLGGEYGTTKERWQAMVDATEPLRQVGRAGRGLSPAFFKTISEQYELLAKEGERHPVKALGEMHGATISAASRWVKEARRLGLLPPKERKEQP